MAPVAPPPLSHPHAWWRGVETCVRADAMLSGMVLILTAQGHAGIAQGLQLTQGSYMPWSQYSANTHAGCGVVDISRFNRLTGARWTAAEWALIVTAARMVGFAAWHRDAIKDLWVEHAHLVAVGCPELSQDAKDQVVEYHQGYDGLKGNGLDNGPRDWVTVTWETQAPAAGRKKTMTALLHTNLGDYWLATEFNVQLIQPAYLTAAKILGGEPQECLAADVTRLQEICHANRLQAHADVVTTAQVDVAAIAKAVAAVIPPDAPADADAVARAVVQLMAEAFGKAAANS